VEVDIILEHVEVVFTAFHPFRSDLRVVLTSPAKTKSVLSTLHGTSSSYEFQVISPKSMAKTFQIARALFGPSPAEWEQQNATARIVLAVPLDGCDLSPSTDLHGVLVLVQRGKCDFTQKVKCAQSRGAAAVLVVPEREGDPPTEMSGMDSSIIIPAVMLSGKDGHTLISQLSSSVPVIGMLVAHVHKQAGLLPFNDWTFSTVRNWNESSVGDWTLSVSDMSAGGIGTFDRWQLKLYGVQGSSSSPPPKLHRPHHNINKTRIVLFVIVIIAIGSIGLVLGWWVTRGRTYHSVQPLFVSIPMEDKQ